MIGLAMQVVMHNEDDSPCANCLKFCYSKQQQYQGDMSENGQRYIPLGVQRPSVASNDAIAND